MDDESVESFNTDDDADDDGDDDCDDDNDDWYCDADYDDDASTPTRSKVAAAAMLVDAVNNVFALPFLRLRDDAASLSLSLYASMHHCSIVVIVRRHRQCR